MIGFYMEPYMYVVGDGQFLITLISTIHIRIDKKQWGKSYPILTKDLYWNGRVPKEKAKELKAELVALRDELKKYTIDDIVWDLEDVDKEVPKPIMDVLLSYEFADLSYCFMSYEQLDLIGLIDAAMDVCIEYNKDMTIEVLTDIPIPDVEVLTIKSLIR